MPCNDVHRGGNVPDISGRDGSKPTMLIMDNDRMALMALQSILRQACCWYYWALRCAGASAW
ncbi:hypothetical protein CE164_08865 [Bifidobacterium breve]|nr:hypothetical protein CE164_08865 [Bifidobacterium breve]RDX29798.1 hypothetical protein CE163_07205 [Bifidobacterium breve]